MAADTRVGRRSFLALAGAVVALGVAGCTTRPRPESAPRPFVPTTAPVSPRAAVPGHGRFATAVSADGRHILDEDGLPLLGLADTVWTMPATYSHDEQRRYFETRAEQGFTALHVAAWPFHFRGDDLVEACTDGVQPFVGGDITRWDETYWSRFDALLDLAAQHGITAYVGLMTTGFSLDLAPGRARRYGELLGARYSGRPNVVWLFGVDYAQQEWAGTDPSFLACLDGLRAAGDRHLATIQLANDDSTSSDNPAWDGRVDLQAAYTYRSTDTVLRNAWRLGAGPVILVESNYEDENNEGGPPTTDATIRRQALWTFTSGGVHVAYGKRSVWRSEDLTVAGLRTTAAEQSARVLAKMSSLEWHRLVPDVEGQVLVHGAGEQTSRGTQRGGFAAPLESDHATCAADPEHDLVVAYLPSARPVAVTLGTLGSANPPEVEWWDPTTGASTAGVWAETLTPPAETHEGGHTDWLLVITRRAADR